MNGPGNNRPMGPPPHLPGMAPAVNLPECMVLPAFDTNIVGTPEWMEANKEALAGPNPPNPPPEQSVARVTAGFHVIWPSSILPQQAWRQIKMPYRVLHEMPLLQLVAEAEAELKRRELAAAGEPNG